MEAFLLQGLFLMCCILLVQSLVCYDCCGVSHPVHCTRTKTCKGAEVCFTKRRVRNNHEMFYNSGCAIDNTCTKRNPFKGLHECVRFCNTDRCNDKPCLGSGYARKRSCKEYKEAGLPSGVYTVQLCDGLPPFQVYCDMDTSGGGWTVFQRRKDGSVDFFRGWEDYKQGFGNLSGEFWLGNDHLHRLTKAGLTTLRVDLGDWEGNTAYAQYSSFRVGPASDYYRLNVSGYSGTASDSLSYQSGMAFSTKDADHDIVPNANCAEVFASAWWHRTCHYSNLNGKYHVGGKAPHGVGVNWYHWRGHYYSLKAAEMKLREP